MGQCQQEAQLILCFLFEVKVWLPVSFAVLKLDSILSRKDKQKHRGVRIWNTSRLEDSAHPGTSRGQV